MIPGLILYRFDSALIFFNADHFKSRALQMIAESPTPVSWFVLDASSINIIDITAIHTIHDLRVELESRGIVLGIARPKRLMRSKLKLGGLKEDIGRDHIFVTVGSAVKAYNRDRKRQQASAEAGETN